MDIARLVESLLFPPNFTKLNLDLTEARILALYEEAKLKYPKDPKLDLDDEQYANRLVTMVKRALTRYIVERATCQNVIKTVHRERLGNEANDEFFFHINKLASLKPELP